MSDLVKRIDEIVRNHREWMRGIRTDRLIGSDDKQTRNDIIDLLVSELEVRVADIIGENDGVVLSYRTMKPRKTLDNTRRTVRDVLRAEQRHRAKESITQLQAMKEGE